MDSSDLVVTEYQDIYLCGCWNIQEICIPQSKVTDLSTAGGEVRLLIPELLEGDDWCRDPELLNHSFAWVHAIHWRNAF